MPNFDSLGRWLILLGVIIVGVGALIWLVGRIPALKQLPGTLTLNLGGLTCIVPILGSILLSIILTVILNLVIRFLRR